MKQETIFDISITFSKTRYTFFCHFLPFPKAPVKNLLKLCTWCSRVKSTCSTSSLTIIYSRFLVSWRQLPGEKTDINSTSSLTIIYSHFLVSWRQLLGKRQTSTFYVNLYENVTSVGYLAQLLLLNPEK